MLLNQFDKRFPDEEACKTYFKSVRQSVGVICSACGCKEHKWLLSRQSFQCESCGHRTPLTAGTAMEHSKLPLRDWFYTAHLMTSIKQVLSAKEVQHQLGVSPQYVSRILSGSTNFSFKSVAEIERKLGISCMEAAMV